MKVLLVIALVTCTLTGCAVLSRPEFVSMADQRSSCAMGSMNMGGDIGRWMYGPDRQPWTGGDDPFFVRSNI